MPGFESALAANPAPRRLGDITLTYESSMLIGETRRRRTIRPTVAGALGLSALAGALGAFVASASPAPAMALTAVGALSLVAATWLKVVERRTRRFVVNFGTTSLRLDFVTPFAGRPRTLVVHFDAVRSVDLLEQQDGAHCLTVDFVLSVGLHEVLREVLVAFIVPGEIEEADRLRRVLTGAFGLGAAPHDSPALEPPGEDGPTQ